MKYADRWQRKKPLNDEELARVLREGRNIGLVGIGAMTRMVQKAYRVADAVRAAGVPVVMGGPHVTECPDEGLGVSWGGRNEAIQADAVAPWAKPPLITHGQDC